MNSSHVKKCDKPNILYQKLYEKSESIRNARSLHFNFITHTKQVTKRARIVRYEQRH